VAKLYISELSRVIVLDPFDVILAKVSSCLDFNEDQLNITAIANAVQLAHLNADGLTWMLDESFTIYYYGCYTGDNEPMFATLLMPLIRQPRARFYIDALNFVCITFL
jgi:hypothetical protein